MIISQLLVIIFLILMIAITILSILLIKEFKENNAIYVSKSENEKENSYNTDNITTDSSESKLKKHYYVESEKSINRNKNTHKYYNNESNIKAKQDLTGNFYNTPLKKSSINTNNTISETTTMIYNGIYDDNLLYCGKNDTKNGNEFLFYGTEDNGETMTKNLPIQYMDHNSSNNNIDMDIGELVYDETEKRFSFKSQESVQTLPKPQKIGASEHVQNDTSSVVFENEVNLDKHKIKIGDTIIFFYNNERYSSIVLNIKHDNLKVIYRSKEKWINLTDVKKVL